MKKVLTILLVALLICSVGCAVQEELQIPPVEADSSTEINNTAASSVEADAERAMPTFSSVEELTAAVQTERQAKTKSSLARSGDLETLSVTYAPANEFEGFHLRNIEVMPEIVFYYYEPDGESGPYFEWDTGIIFMIYRDPECTLSLLCEPYGITPDEDGFAYNSETEKMYFERDGTAICVKVPEHMNNYDTIRSLCAMKKVEIP